MNTPLRAKKHLGQHFLRDKRIIQQILDLLELAQEDRVLEIGPGPGTLTLPLNREGISISVVETDLDMVTHLQDHSFSPPIEIIHADFLTLTMTHFIHAETKILSNLPYKTSVPITARLLEVAQWIPLMVMMYQKEVADRIRANPNTKDYGPISVLCQLFYDISVKIKVHPGAFRPPPKVQSRVLRFRRKSHWIFEPESVRPLNTLLHFAFQNRRKMIGTTLRKGTNISPWSRAAIAAAFEGCGLNPQSRPENLEPEAYAAWFGRLARQKK